MSGKLHDQLKNWLLEVGEHSVDRKGKLYYTRTYSGDSEPLDIRKGKKHVEYRPDVIFERGKSRFIIEIAQNDPWLAWVGEVFMAKLATGFWGVCLVLFDEGRELVRNRLGLVEIVLEFKPNYLYYVVLEGEEATNIDLAKKTLRLYLEKKGWL